MTKEILDFLKMNDVKYRENFPLSLISAIKIGGNCSCLVYPDSSDKLVNIIDFLEDNKIQYKILGRMSNTLPCDTKYEGVIIRTDHMSSFSFSARGVIADAGISLPYLARLSAEHGLSGLEELAGIPGSFGASIRGNSGAYGREVSDLVSRVKIYNLKTKQVEIKYRYDLCFDYRDSNIKKEDHIVLSAKLSLVKGESENINKLIQEYRDKRIASQPLGQPSLGSSFKRIKSDIPVSKMIDKCGLKGYKIGDAMISNKHAGFIVNCGRATASDYLRLAEIVETTVYQKFGVVLEREFEVI